jgi:hypothetical protein
LDSPASLAGKNEKNAERFGGAENLIGGVERDQALKAKKENPQMLSQMRAKASLLLEEISGDYRVMYMTGVAHSVIAILSSL